MTDLWYKKLLCFLHDPIDKSLILSRGTGHEKHAEELAKMIEIDFKDFKKHNLEISDHLASAMERGFLPKGKKFPISFANESDNKPVRIHPLSGKRVEFEELTKMNINEIKMKTKNVFKQISNDIKKYDKKKKLFYLWRNLPDLMNKEYESAEINIIPADTRIPDHSVWSHLSTTSSLVGGAKSSLFLFTLGPVQSFISQARKLQDLYWGSFILSYMNCVAIKTFINEYGPESVIFPSMYKQPLMDKFIEEKLNIKIYNSNKENVNIPTLPNRFLGIIPHQNEDEIRALYSKIEKNIQDSWSDIYYNNISLFLENKVEFDNETTKKQLSNFLEKYFVAVPLSVSGKEKSSLNETIDKIIYNKEGESFVKKFKKFINKANKITGWNQSASQIGQIYSAVYTYVEKMMGVRKSKRDFNQFEQKGNKPGEDKCHICGERNYLFGGKNFNLPQYYLKENEKLCAVCFGKRLLKNYFEDKIDKDISFPSISEIALSNFKKEIPKTNINKYKRIINDIVGNYDDKYLYENEIDNENAFNSEEKKLIKNKLKDISKKVNVKKTKYYGVIMFDGDKMGKWLSGDKAPTFDKIYHPEVWNALPEELKKHIKCKKRIMTPALHRSISDALREFTLNYVIDIVEKYSTGKIVYAGGDDILAFVPLQDLFTVLERLRAAFSGNLLFNNSKKDFNYSIDYRNENITGFVKENKYRTLMGPEATASAGVVIAHYKTPLYLVLNRAREAEKEAKKYGRNSFMMYVLKHSGEILKSILKFSINEKREKDCKDKKDKGECDDISARKNINNINILKNILQIFESIKTKNDKSLSFIFNIEKEFRKIYKTDEFEDVIMFSELKRLIKKSTNQRRINVDLLNNINDLWNLSDYINCKNEEINKFDNWIDMLKILIFLLRQGGAK